MSKIYQGDVFDFVASLNYSNKEIAKEIETEINGGKVPTVFTVSRIRSKTVNGIKDLNANWWYDYFILEYLEKVTDKTFDTYEGTDYEESKEIIRKEKERELFRYAKDFVDENNFEFEGRENAKELKEYIVSMFKAGLENHKKSASKKIKEDHQEKI